ncbi:metallophosphoesterase [Ruminococcus sp.]|uniref:metallophosphoesterase n=1 Tax=Ruminococcus sp. TaxID=41978 RepID=UPI0025CFF33C|nr:metallophosphoesterase [Ruminococcus sp.]MBQ8967164.1 metallophosphoesterase [Ruminococcus sp.]
MIFGIIPAYILGQTGVSLLTERTLAKGGLGKELFRKTRVLRLIVYIALALLPCMGTFLPDSKAKFFCMKTGNLWLGFFLYYTGLLLLFSAVAAIISKVRKDTEKKAFKVVVHGAAVFAAVITVYGMIHAQNTKVVTYDIEARQGGGSQLKVVLLADLHLSVNSLPETTEKMVEKVNACDADVILVAGDIFTSTYGGLEDPDRYSAALSKLEAKYGVYAVAGNHDVEEALFGGFAVAPVSKAFRTKEMDDFFEACDFKMLYDESIELDDTDVIIVGRKDGEKAGDGTKKRLSAKKLLKDCDPDKLKIVLEHEPKDYEKLAKNGADMVLSGHTHNGQLFPGNLVVPFFNENAYGCKTLFGMPTVVTAGTGYYGPPMRVGTDSEITVINITY